MSEIRWGIVSAYVQITVCVDVAEDEEGGVCGGEQPVEVTGRIEASPIGVGPHGELVACSVKGRLDSHAVIIGW